MNDSALPPSASTTLVILLGASAWPNSPGIQASKAFVHAAQGFRNYLLDPRGFGLTKANLLDQFDAQTSSSEQLELLGSFLEQRTQALKSTKQAAHDVLVYFVGHGGFVGSFADFYLLLRRTNASSLRSSGMAIDALAEVLREKARQTRRYLFLDCCFAAAAFRSFQGGPDQTAIMKTLNAFHVQTRSSGFPGKGTVLLCSSDQKSPSLLLPDESCTMFSSALLDVLRNGDLHRPLRLSLRDIKELAEDRLATLPEKEAPRPGLHSPDQSEGDVADVPFFPNPRAEEERRRQIEEAKRARLGMEKHMQNIAEQLFPMPSQTFPPTSSDGPVLSQPSPFVGEVTPASQTSLPMQFTRLSTPSPVSPDARMPRKPPKRGISRGRAILLIGLTLLVIVASLGLFFVVRNQQIATDNAYTTATARANVVTVTAHANATSQAVAATSTAIADSQAAAATSTAIADPRTPYAAPIPGPCDKGGARWDFANGNNTSYDCLSDSIRLVATDSVSIVHFYGRAQIFAHNYAIAVEVFNLTAGCVSIIARGNRKGEYVFDVCQDGSWWITKETGLYPPVTLNSGTIMSHSSFKMTATCSGSTQILTIDGIQVGASNDTTYTTTDFTALVLSSPGQASASANFKNFQYTPLP